MTIYLNRFQELSKTAKKQFEKTKEIQEQAAFDMLNYFLKEKDKEIVLGDDRGV
tara:strand:+ start:25 stop:186 length:162 start_codon:yes stop_codon:yes gene_type:complete